ncbi:MAG: response regulator transcription factor [Devosia nanyangense]|uniref:Response regulator transcription factor n=1 Tax=Devosia nanyangense TaxID=1228055 RepID=A0A933KY14_9HYPH|nr:response regulator transcription factor [Devosia nanyangense]
MRILLAEDDDRIAGNVAAALELAGFAVDRQSDGEEIWFRGETETYDAVVLDLGLPSLDGLTILKRWRRAGRAMPVLILTARGNWDERVEGIDGGADDYLTKPFRVEELVARLRALIRRATGNPAPVIEAGEIALDTRQMRVSRLGQPIALTPQEYRLVSYLMHHRGRVIDQLELTEHLYLQDFERDSNAVEVLVGRVRRKLGADVIRTRRGFGYVIEAET